MIKKIFSTLYILLILSPILALAGQVSTSSQITSKPDTVYLSMDFETYNKNVYQRVDANIGLPDYIKNSIGITTTTTNIDNVIIDTQTTVPSKVYDYLQQKTGQTYPFLKSETYNVPINTNKQITVTDYYFIQDPTTALVVRTNNKNKLKETYKIARSQTYVPGEDSYNDNHDNEHGNDDKNESGDDYDKEHGNDDKNESDDDHDKGYGNDNHRNVDNDKHKNENKHDEEHDEHGNNGHDKHHHDNE